MRYITEQAARPELQVNCVHLDFETRSREGIDGGAWRYSKHPSTTVMCLAYRFDEEPTVYLWWPPWVTAIVGWSPNQEAADRLHDCIRFTSCRMKAHNAQFEEAIWENVMPRFGWHFIAKDRWECTASLARSMGLPGALGKVAQALGLAHQKDAAGHRIMLQLTKPKKPSKKDPGEWYNDRRRFFAMFDYCRQDVRTEAALCHKLAALHPDERNLWELDQEINRRGVPVDLSMCAGALEVIATAKARLHERFRAITGIERATMRQQFHEWLVTRAPPKCHRVGYTVKGAKGPRTEYRWEAIDESDPPDWMPPDNFTQETRRDFLLDHDPGYPKTPPPVVPPDVVEAIRVYGLANKRAADKFLAFMKCCEADGRARGFLVFCGAHTGRWTSHGPQLHNMKRGNLKQAWAEFGATLLRTGDYSLMRMFFKHPYDTTGSLARGAIMAPPGYKLVWADFSAIEARTLFWLADDPDGLGLYARGEDVYKEMAATIYGIPVAEIMDESEERWQGKQTVLGCGYQMSAERFVEQCRGYGKVVPIELARRSVSAFRSRFKRVPVFWKDCNAAAILAVTQPGARPVVGGKMAFQMMGPDWLAVTLPSGRVTWYYKPRIRTRTIRKEGREPFTTTGVCYQGWDKGSLRTKDMYGGKWAENICQGVARDVMGYHMLKASRRLPEQRAHVERVSAASEKKVMNPLDISRPWCIITHTHDEVVCEEPMGGRAAADLAAEMSEPPPWAPGLPVAAEGKEGTRYRK